MIKALITSLSLMMVSTLLVAGGGPHKFDKCVHATLKERPGNIVKVELKNEEGKHVYEFSVHGKDGTKWDLECNAYRGLISEVEREVDSVRHPLFKAKMKISEADAAKIALAIYPGEIAKVEYEIEPNGAASYEFDINTIIADQEMKVEVVASDCNNVVCADTVLSLSERLTWL